LTLVTGTADAAQFGKELPGYTIPQALKAIFAQDGGGTVLVVNVLSVADNIDTETSEVHVITDGVTKLTYAPYDRTAAVVKNSAGTVTYTYGTDYTLDEYGNLRAIATITEGQTIKVTYTRLTPATVTNSQFIGDNVSGVRTGMFLFELAYNTFGFRPKIFIAPWYSTVQAIANELTAAAEAYRAIALLDGVADWIPSEAIADRGLGGDTFATQDDRAYLVYPQVQAYDPYSDEDEVRPASMFVAGLIAANDRKNGYWFSPSNKQIKGITGVERVIQWGLNDATCEANLLNEAGITTIVAGFGTGNLLWGNRSAAYPSVTTPINFISTRRVSDVLTESLELSLLQFVDKPLNAAVIDAVKESCNAFIRTLIQRGALVDGRCEYLPESNSAAELAAGHVTFDISFMPPSPAERITLNTFIDVNLLRAIQ